MVGQRCITSGGEGSRNRLRQHHHQTHGCVFGTKDTDGDFIVPSGAYWEFKENIFPSGDWASSYPGVTASGTFVKHYDKYTGDRPPVYGELDTPLDVTIAGMTGDGGWYKDEEICDSLNGTYRLTNTADFRQQSLISTNWISSFFGTYATTMGHDIGSLDYLGTIRFDDEGDGGVSSLLTAGYYAASFYLCVAGDDFRWAHQGICEDYESFAPSGEAVNEWNADAVVHRSDDLETKPKIWLAMELLSFHKASVAFPDDDINNPWWGSDHSFYQYPPWYNSYPITGIETEGVTSFSTRTGLFAKYFDYDHNTWPGFNSLYSDTTSSCNRVFAKPIATYNGDFQIERSRYNYINGVSQQTLLTSIIPYHPRCEDLDSNAGDAEIDYESAGFGYAGDFDGENINISATFSANDVVLPHNRLVTARELNSFEASGAIGSACYFNFNVSIQTAAGATSDIDSVPPSTQQLYPSAHLRGTMVDTCYYNSANNKLIPGWDVVKQDAGNGKFYTQVGMPYWGSNSFGASAAWGSSSTEMPIARIYEDEEIPYGSFSQSASVTIAGAASIDPYDEVRGHDYRDATDCEDLNGTHRLIAHYGYSVNEVQHPVINPYAEHKYYAELIDTIGCACDSGICVSELHLTVVPHKNIGYDDSFGYVYDTEVKLEVKRLRGSVWGDVLETVALYNKYLNNTNFIAGEDPSPSGRFGEGNEYPGKTFGYLQPLPISSFQNLVLPLTSGDANYIGTEPEEGVNTKCSLPDSVTVDLYEATEFRKLFAGSKELVYGFNQSSYMQPTDRGDISGPIEYAYVSIPGEGWTRDIDLGDDYTIGFDGTKCSVTMSIPGCVPVVNWWVGTDCDYAYGCDTSRAPYLKCPSPTWTQIRVTTTYTNCEVESNNGVSSNPPYVGDEFANNRPCEEYASEELCDTIWGPLEDQPQGTYACKLQGYTRQTSEYENRLYNPVKDYMNCGHPSWLPNLYSIDGSRHPLIQGSWIYWEDPCEELSVRAGALTAVPPIVGVCPNTYAGDISDELDDYIQWADWVTPYGNGINCYSKLRQVKVTVIGRPDYYKGGWMWEDIPEEEKGYYFSFRVEILGPCAQIRGGSIGIWCSPPILKSEVGLCTGVNQTVIIDAASIGSVDCYQASPQYFMWGAYFWNPSTPITLTLG